MASKHTARRALELALEAGGLAYWPRAEKWAPLGVGMHSVRVERMGKYGPYFQTVRRPDVEVNPYTVRDLVRDELLQREKPGIVAITAKGRRWLKEQIR